MKYLRKTLMGAGCVALVVSVASPAGATRDRFKDEHGDIRSGLDIRSVYVKNGGDWITIKTKHRNLKRGKDTIAHAYIDTVRGWKGPEFAVAASLGNEYRLYAYRRWHSFGPPVDCHGGLRARVNYRRDVITYSVRRKCLARYYHHGVGKIRAGANAYRVRGRTDWAPRRHRLYPAVRRN